MTRAWVLRNLKLFKVFLDGPDSIAPQYNKVRPMLAFLDSVVVPDDDFAQVNIGADNTLNIMHFMGWRYDMTTSAVLDTRWHFVDVMEHFDLVAVRDCDVNTSLPSNFTEIMSPHMAGPQR